MAGVFLNGVNFFPSDISVEFTKQGVSLVAASGSRRWAQRVTGGGTAITKGKWVLTWDKATAAIRAAVAAIYVLTTTFTYTDQHGLAYTVLCQGESDGFKTSVPLITIDGSLYYSIELVIYQV